MNNSDNENLDIGKLGESLASRFLEERGFKVIERNYYRKWGEIDIVSSKTIKNKGFNLNFLKKEQILHFVEVKTVSCEMSEGVTHETNENVFKPQDNIDPHKLKRLSKVIESYLKKVSKEQEWQFDVIAIWVDPYSKKARIEFIENIPL